MANLDALQENSMSSRWAYCIPIKILQMIAEKNVYIIYIYLFIYLFIYLYMCVCVCVYVCVFREKLRKHTSTTLHQLADSQSPRFFERGTTIDPSKVLRDPTGNGPPLVKSPFLTLRNGANWC